MSGVLRNIKADIALAKKTGEEAMAMMSPEAIREETGTGAESKREEKEDAKK